MAAFAASARYGTNTNLAKAIFVYMANPNKNFDCLARLDKWDEATQKTILERIKNETGKELSFRFLSQEQGEVLKKITDILIPQNPNNTYIKISEAIDRSLATKKSGVRYGQNPWRLEFYQKGLREFPAEFDEKTFKIIIEGPDTFLKRFLKLVLTDATVIYYSHPSAWNKIGFPGPAYPIGYAFLGCQEKEDWEADYSKNDGE